MGRHDFRPLRVRQSAQQLLSVDRNARQICNLIKDRSDIAGIIITEMSKYSYRGSLRLPLQS